MSSVPLTWTPSFKKVPLTELFSFDVSWPFMVLLVLLIWMCNLDALLEGLLALSINDPTTLFLIKYATTFILLFSDVHFLSALSKYKIPSNMELAHRTHIIVCQSLSRWWLGEASKSRITCKYSLVCCSSTLTFLHVVFIILVVRWKIITNGWFWWQTINSIIWEPSQDIWVTATLFCCFIFLS